MPVKMDEAREHFVFSIAMLILSIRVLDDCICVDGTQIWGMSHGGTFVKLDDNGE